MRTRQCTEAREHRFKTYEVDDALRGFVTSTALRPSRIKHMADTAGRAQRNKAIAKLLQAGEKHAVIAQQFGISDNMVSTIAKNMGITTSRRQR